MDGIVLLFVCLCSCEVLQCIVPMLSLGTWVPVSFKENKVIINNLFVCNYWNDTNEKEQNDTRGSASRWNISNAYGRIWRGTLIVSAVSVQLIVSTAFPNNGRGVDTASSYQRHRWVHSEGGNKMLVTIGQLMARAPCLHAPANLRKHSSGR